MKLQLYRDHLGSELRRLPDLRDQKIQSYALTTAILARKIIRHLRIDDMRLPSAGGPARTDHSLSSILNAFIHYEAFYPRPPIEHDDPNNIIVILHSKRNREYLKHMHIRMSHFFAAISELADNDQLMSEYVLRRSVTVLSQVDNSYDMLDPHILQLAVDFISDTLDLTNRINKTRAFSLSNCIQIPCYRNVADEPLRDTPVWHRELPFTCPKFVFGFGTTWWMSPFKPSKKEIAGSEVCCVYIEKTRPNPNSGVDHFVVPLSSVIDVLKVVQVAIGRRSED